MSKLPTASKVFRAGRRILLLLAALAVSSAVAPVTQAEETIKFVSSLPRTGSANSQTSSMVNGIKLALEEAGYRAGPFTISYEDWDDASPERGNWDPSIEASNAEKAIKDPDVMVYIGPYNSGAAKVSMPKLNQAGLVDINPGNTWPGLTKPGTGEPNEPDIYRPSKRVTYFRVVPADDIQGVVGAKWAKDLGITRVYILHDRELYGKGIAGVFQKSAEKLGIEVAGVDGIDVKAANYKSLVTKIKQKNPQLIYFGGTTQSNAGQLAKDIVSGGLNVKIMSPDGTFENAYIESAGKSVLEGRALITFGGVPASELTGKGAEFYASYKKRFNAEPEAYAAYGYECGRVGLEAVKRAGKKDRAAILQAVAETKDFEGALGTWSFDQNGDTTLTTMSGNTVENGAFKFVKLLKN